MRTTILAPALFLACSACAVGVYAAERTKTVEYQHDDVTFEGYVAWDDSQQGHRPGVVIVHD